jgi:tRNA dimethylallyltransferase
MPGGSFKGTVLLGGSTASGKSALALALAERTGGVILNADSVQLYRDLPILTARPGPADLARAEHRLYGILEAHEVSSVAAWLERIEPELQDLERAGRLAILTGGTGLYFKALVQGLPVMPEIPPAIRAELRQSPLESEVLHARLAALDPALAARLQASDRQRILRGLEVALATGRPLTGWQADPPRRVGLAAPVAGLALLPPAAVVDPRIEARLEAMLEAGLLEELRAFRAGPGRRPTPLAKADGVAELGSHLDGAIDLEAAKRATVLKVRRYAKRQRTFFKGQLAQVLQPLAMVADAEQVEPLAATLLGRLEDTADHRPG